MEKSLKILGIFKKIVALLTSICLFVGALLHIALSYSGGAYKVALSVIAGFCAGFVLYMCLNIATLIIEKLQEKQQNFSYENKEVCSNKFVNSLYNFTNKNKFVIGLCLSVVAIATSMILVCQFGSKAISQYWRVYFYLVLALWSFIIYSVFSLVQSKNKKSFIISAVFSSLLIVLNIVLTVLACIMMFGKIGQFNNTVVYDVLLSIFALLTVVPFGLITTNGDFDAYKFNTSFGLGTMAFILGTVLINGKPIIKRLFYMHNVNGSVEDILALKTVTAILFVVLSAVIVLNTFNISYNLKKFIKQKEYFGLADILLGIVGTVLFIVGTYNYTIILLTL